MTEHMRKELNHLEQRLLSLTALVQENIRQAIVSFKNRDVPLAQKVRDADQEIDQQEVEIEEECLKMLALYQPVASDLRYIVAAMKINNDLERVGDLANNIAKTVPVMAEHPNISIPLDLDSYTEETINLLDRTIDAFINLNLQTAKELLQEDEKIDEYNREVQRLIPAILRENPRHEAACVQVLWVSQCLERIGDHATNIAEDIIYLLEGEIVRHQDKLKKRTS